MLKDCMQCVGTAPSQVKYSLACLGEREESVRYVKVVIESLS